MHIDHAVDQTRAAQPFAARDRNRAIVGILFRLSLKAPVVGGVIEQLSKAGWDIDPHTFRLAPGF